MSARLRELDWVSDLLVAGSAATGDYVSGVSDLDLVALVDGPLTREREFALVALHQELDLHAANGANLGCVYLDTASLLDPEYRHPTWTHGRLVHRILSGVTRAELVTNGFALLGREPTLLFPPMSLEQVRGAAWDELFGYWAWASRRPWLWLNPMIADLGLTSMARARSTLRTGRLLTKSEAIQQANAPRWLRDQMVARRRGDGAVSPRLRTGWLAWRDARRTLRFAVRVHDPSAPSTTPTPSTTTPRPCSTP